MTWNLDLKKFLAHNWIQTKSNISIKMLQIPFWIFKTGFDSTEKKSNGKILGSEKRKEELGETRVMPGWEKNGCNLDSNSESKNFRLKFAPWLQPFN